ncbi:uncharacterized protein PAC_14778 [Phialocephala subalpina]|uniref:Uncharacterized protein n=1 Tax=Phialocephala subalpina TaxID=576137 RepID=A0A1L7XIN1_9HELO|nr:uncharacterized protein PAC_14778 [Phialocephala subalpina]
MEARKRQSSEQRSRAPLKPSAFRGRHKWRYFQPDAAQDLNDIPASSQWALYLVPAEGAALPFTSGVYGLEKRTKVWLPIPNSEKKKLYYRVALERTYAEWLLAHGYGIQPDLNPVEPQAVEVHGISIAKAKAVTETATYATLSGQPGLRSCYRPAAPEPLSVPIKWAILCSDALDPPPSRAKIAKYLIFISLTWREDNKDTVDELLQKNVHQYLQAFQDIADHLTKRYPLQLIASRSFRNCGQLLDISILRSLIGVAGGRHDPEQCLRRRCTASESNMRELRSRCIEVPLTTNNRQSGRESTHIEQIPDPTATPTPEQVTAPASDPTTAVQDSALDTNSATGNAAPAHASHQMGGLEDTVRHLTASSVSDGGISDNHGAGSNQVTDSSSNPTVDTTPHGHSDADRVAPDTSASHVIGIADDDPNDSDMIVVDAAPEPDESIPSRNSIVPQHLNWIIDGADFLDEGKTLNDNIIDRPRQFHRGNPIRKRLEQRRAYHVGTMSKLLYNLVEQVNARQHAESLPEPASYDEFLSSELAATSVTRDVLHFLRGRVGEYRKELSRTRHQLKE